jgi:hypothetical protein
VLAAFNQTMSVMTSTIANTPYNRSDRPSGMGPRMAHFGTKREREDV